ncbi:hypothetical protein V6N12_069499 [Hibiscus sabdariffa]|uniref:Uncharacterized protein n=1 Tax=Hibiscus sabdariffa TaxID=183260 RepID=A0ABR2FE59_9ROSI
MTVCSPDVVPVMQDLATYSWPGAPCNFHLNVCPLDVVPVMQDLDTYSWTSRPVGDVVPQIQLAQLSREITSFLARLCVLQATWSPPVPALDLASSS